jgi:hypothetical protein
LWVDPAPIPPWVYRKARRGQSFDLSDLVPLDAETEGVAATRGPPLLGAREPDSAASSSPYPIIGNRKSHIYHRPDCPNYSQVAPHNRAAFNSAAEAEASGYRVAGNWSMRVILCRRGSGGNGTRVSGPAYSLALARLASACVARSGTRIVGLNKSGSESASRSPNDTQKNGATRSIVRMGRRTFWRASVVMYLR